MSNPVKKLEIMLDHDIDEQYQYEPGEVIRGKVVLIITDTMRISSIQLQVKGEATVSWEDGDVGLFSTSETYVEDTVDILGGKDKSAGLSLDRGEHSYPIAYVLPQNLPSSFIGKFGSITYVLKATVREDNRFGFGSTITSEPFLILRKLDVLSQPELQTPRKISLSKRASGGMCFCVFGKTACNFSVNRTGLLPGDDILIDAEIENNSSRAVTAVQVCLVLNSTFHAKNKSRRHSQIVAKKLDQCEMDHGDMRQWKAVKLAVPPYIPESRLDGCDMIDIDYELQFRVELEGGADVRESIPVMIGTPSDEKKDVPQSYSADNGTENRPVSGYYPENDENEMDQKVIDKFRHPMEYGATRENILYEENDFSQELD